MSALTKLPHGASLLAGGNMAVNEQGEGRQEQNRHVGGDKMDLSCDDMTNNDACAMSLIYDRVVEKLSAMRRDCRTERVELTESVESQLRDMRTESMSTRSEQQQLQREIRTLQEKLQNAVIHRASLLRGSAGQPDTCALARTSQRLHRDTQQALSEVELLKAAVFHDRLSREERQKAEDAEDEELEVRLQQAEAANAELQRTVMQLRAQNKQLVGVMQGIVDSMQHRQPWVAQQQAQLKQALEAFARLQAEHARVAGTVESLVHSTEQYKATHDCTLQKLEKTVMELERQEKEKHLVVGGITREHFAMEDGNMWNQNTPLSLDTATCRPLRQRLEHFYSLYNPERISAVDVIIDEYAGAEEELMAALEVHYGAFGFFSHH